MADFQLGSVDWDTVVLLHGAHLRAETSYLEDLVRWSLRYGRPWGILSLGEDDLQVLGSSTDYEITLRSCQAITPQGYWVEVREPVTLQGSNDRHRDSVVPIYLGVGEEKESVNLAPARSEALLECRSLYRRYVLSCEPTETDVDWLPIGQMKKDGPRFVRDEEFIPECVHLNSHWKLIKRVESIRKQAEECLRALQPHLLNRQPIAGIIATALSPAAVVVNWRDSPLAYLERLAAVLTAQEKLLWLVEEDKSVGREDKSVWTKANDCLGAALRFIQQNTGYDRENLDWAEALRLVKEALEALTSMCEGLKEVSPKGPLEEERPLPQHREEPVVPTGVKVGPFIRRHR